MTTHITSNWRPIGLVETKKPQFPPGYLQVTIFKVQQISQTSHPSWHSPCSSRSRWSAEPNSCTDICSVIRARQNPSFPFSISAGQLISLFYGCIHTCAESRDILCERCGILSWSIKEGYSSPQKELQTFIFSPFLATVFGFNLVAKNRGIFPISSNLALRHLSVVRAAVQDLQIFNKFQRCNSCRPAPKTWRLPSPHYCSPSTSPSEYLSRRFWVVFQEGKKLKQKSKTEKSAFHLWALPSTSSAARWTRQVAAQNVSSFNTICSSTSTTCSPQSCCQSLRILPQNVCWGFSWDLQTRNRLKGHLDLPKAPKAPRRSLELHGESMSKYINVFFQSFRGMMMILSKAVTALRSLFPTSLRCWSLRPWSIRAEGCSPDRACRCLPCLLVAIYVFAHDNQQMQTLAAAHCNGPKEGTLNNLVHTWVVEY